MVPPQVVLFAHSHRRETWHRSKPLDELVNNLQWETVTGFEYLEPDPAAMKPLYIQNATEIMAGRQRRPPYNDNDEFEPHCNEVSISRTPHQILLGFKLITCVFHVPSSISTMSVLSLPH